jgi:signal peptidase I
MAEQPPVGGTGPNEQPEPPNASSSPKRQHRLTGTLITLIVMVLGAAILRLLVFESFTVPSGSMYPTIKPGNHIAVSKLNYHIGSPARGDVIVFTSPENLNCPGPHPGDLVKRVIGLPGERISGTGLHPKINGHLIEQPYLSTASGGVAIKPQTIPANQYFVMGDNRGDSCDSRYWGNVTSSQIVGKAEAVIWPLSDIHRL